MSPRRLTLQLTPLLDLLLIVIFAQYMEVRENEAVVEQTSHAAMVERDAALMELAALEGEILTLRQELDDVQQMVVEAEGEQVQQERKLELIQEDLDRALAQHRVLGELVVELFQVPSEEVQRILDPANYPAGAFSREELQRLRERFRELSMKRAGRMIEHLLSYEEIRKRADVWEVHLEANNVAVIQNGPESTRIRIPFLANGRVDQERFLAEFYMWYRSMPQPKSLVIILLTYEREIIVPVTMAIREALPQLASRMQQDSGGRTRFEYADLGYRIE